MSICIEKNQPNQGLMVFPKKWFWSIGLADGLGAACGRLGAAPETMRLQAVGQSSL
jgi:hypothetical protein